jgi:hypothetical protein
MKPIILLSLTQIKHLFLEIIEIINIATFTANASNNLQVKILLELVQLIALWHVSQNRNETRSNSSAQVVSRPIGMQR